MTQTVNDCWVTASSFVLVASGAPDDYSGFGSAEAAYNDVAYYPDGQFTRFTVSFAEYVYVL